MVIAWSNEPWFPGDALAWIKAEARKGTNEIGFVPWPRVERDAGLGRVVVAVENGDLVAWSLVGAPRPVRVITQLWTRRDARRFAFARGLVDEIAAKSRVGLSRAMQATCAADIEGWQLWAACGFVLHQMKDGGRCRGRRLGVFRRSLVGG